MRIGFDVSQTGRSKAGCGCFADSLIQHLAAIDSENEYVLYPTFGNLYWDPDWKRSVRRIDHPRFRWGKGHGTFDAAQFFWSDQPDGLPHGLEAHLDHPDILHTNNFFCPKGLTKARLVYTLHDLSFLDHPEWHTEANRVGCFEGVFNACLYADFIISVSHYSRLHFLEVFPHFPADRVAVIHLASRFAHRPDLPRPAALSHLSPGQFWLNVGTIEPRKNQVRLLYAYAALKAREGRLFPLVLAGGHGWLMQDFEKHLETLDLKQDVICLGYVDDAALQWLYQNCLTLVYPSLFEGFGLPVLEAMSLGAPVIASNVTSIPEIVGDSGILVDPRDTEAISNAMWVMWKEPAVHARLKADGMERAKAFSWEKAAGALLEHYRTITRRG